LRVGRFRNKRDEGSVTTFRKTTVGMETLYFLDEILFNNLLILLDEATYPIRSWAFIAPAFPYNFLDL